LVVGVARSSDKLLRIQQDLSSSFVPMVCDVSKKQEIRNISEQMLELARISHTFSEQIAALPIEIASQVGEDSVHATRPRATGMSLN
jgi:hypothetical protein